MSKIHFLISLVAIKEKNGQDNSHSQVVVMHLGLINVPVFRMEIDIVLIKLKGQLRNRSQNFTLFKHLLISTTSLGIY